MTAFCREALPSLAISEWPTAYARSGRCLHLGAFLRHGTAKQREVGLLPPAIGARSIARPRAIALRERRFPCDVIAGWLDAEGYASPNTDPGHWTRSDVLTLLRKACSLQPATPLDESHSAEAALLQTSIGARLRPWHRTTTLSAATSTGRGQMAASIRRT